MTAQTTHPHADAPAPWAFDHVNVSVGNDHALSALFEDVMGLHIGPRPPFPFPGRWLYANGQAVVHAVNDPNTDAVGFGHIAFRSDRPMAPLVEQLRRSELPFRIARVPDDQTAQIFVLLPGNFVVELNVPNEGALTTSHTYSADQTSPNASHF